MYWLKKKRKVLVVLSEDRVLLIPLVTPISPSLGNRLTKMERSVTTQNSELGGTILIQSLAN